MNGYVSLSLSIVTGPPPTSPYGAAAPGVSYAQMITPTAPPSYVESLNHPVVAGPPGIPPQYSPYVTQATAAAASAGPLQNYKVGGALWMNKDVMLGIT